MLEWIGGIPARWETKPLGAVLERNRSNNKGMKVKQVLSLSYGRVVVKPEEKLRGLVPESFETYQVLEPGDVVIRPTDLQNDKTSLRIGQTFTQGIITSAYICLRPRSNMDQRFAAYLLSAYDFMKVFYGFGTGLRQNLDFKHIKHIPIPQPDLVEQLAIVRYLDYAEMRIARAIASKSEMERLLQERKAVLAEDIILGRKSGAALVDSGLPWVGRVPEHWELVPLRSLLFPRKQLVGTRHASFSLLSLTLNGVILRDLSQMKGKFPASFETYQEVRPGDFVFCNFDVEETPRAVGLAREPGMITGAYDVFEGRAPEASEYLYEFLLTADRQKRFAPLYRGMRKSIPRGALLSSAVPLPPPAERDDLVEEVHLRAKSIDEALEVIREEIALLKEYRTRLISDVVTGKLDVRAEAEKLDDIDPAELAAALSGGSAETELGEEEADADD